jgi:phosphohistidine phosphatase
MDFYLVRHGEAVSHVPGPQRHLTARGRDDVTRVARNAAARSVAVFEILHSGILRARETAEILAEYLSPANGVKEAKGLGPEDDPTEKKIELEAAEHSLMIVGHLPYMNRLTALLLTGDPDREVVQFAPAMLVCFRRKNSAWEISWTLAP